MIISKAPFRVSFAGGGSDLESFYGNNGHGAVVSTTIDKYMYIMLHPYFHDKIRIKYSKLEDVDDIKEACIQIHNKLRQALGSKVIMANGIYNGQRFFQDTDRTNDYIDVITSSPLNGFMSEGMWYAQDEEWFTHEKWKKMKNP